MESILKLEVLDKKIEKYVSENCKENVWEYLGISPRQYEMYKYFAAVPLPKMDEKMKAIYINALKENLRNEKITIHDIA